jgi:hypothetical protein
VIIWNPASGEQLSQLNGHGGTVLSVAWNADGSSQMVINGQWEMWVENLGIIYAGLQEVKNEIDQHIFNARGSTLHC